MLATELLGCTWGQTKIIIIQLAQPSFIENILKSWIWCMVGKVPFAFAFFSFITGPLLRHRQKFWKKSWVYQNYQGSSWTVKTKKIYTAQESPRKVERVKKSHHSGAVQPNFANFWNLLKISSENWKFCLIWLFNWNLRMVPPNKAHSSAVPSLPALAVA